MWTSVSPGKEGIAPDALTFDALIDVCEAGASTRSFLYST